MIKKFFGSGGDKNKQSGDENLPDTEKTITVKKSTALPDDPITLDVDRLREGAPSDGSDEHAGKVSRPDSGRGRLSWPARDDNRRQARGEPRASGDDERTRLFNAPKGRSEPAAESGRAVTDRSSDPVVGWVVVLEGPGKGNSVEIGAGANAIGRGAGQQIQLDFGDDKISRERHAVIVYEPEARQFFVQNGEVRNLTYVEGKVVLGVMPLQGGEKIRVGDTYLQFVPFCGPEFSWS